MRLFTVENRSEKLTWYTSGWKGGSKPSFVAEASLSSAVFSLFTSFPGSPGVYPFGGDIVSGRLEYECGEIKLTSGELPNLTCPKPWFVGGPDEESREGVVVFVKAVLL